MLMTALWRECAYGVNRPAGRPLRRSHSTRSRPVRMPVATPASRQLIPEPRERVQLRHLDPGVAARAQVVVGDDDDEAHGWAFRGFATIAATKRKACQGDVHGDAPSYISGLIRATPAAERAGIIYRTRGTRQPQHASPLTATQPARQARVSPGLDKKISSAIISNLRSKYALG
jgi:hypothetical protein